jgi:glucans biosynthesis protein C
MSRTSLALENLRGFVILMVLAFHSFMAYMWSQPASAPPFDAPPYDWTAHPIVDAHRWLGFDLFGAFQFLHLMQLMFFLSGLFVWTSLVRKGTKAFLLDRVFRLGLPFAFGVGLLMPIAYFPVYLVGAIDPNWSAFWSHWTALPFWPSGPLWFLWYVFALNALAAALYRFAPRTGEVLGRLSTYAGSHPERFFTGLVVVSAIAYFPVAAFFEPWEYVEFGPFAFQPALVTQYVIYFLTGLAVGIYGIERGFMAANAMLAQRWWRWLVATAAAFALWVGSAALITQGYDGALLRFVSGIGLVLFAASASFGSIAVSLRFTTERRPLLGAISDNAYGIYLFHYVFVIWTQYALLDLDLPAIVKGAIVLAVTLALSFVCSVAVSSMQIGARLMRGARRTSMTHPQASANAERPQVRLSE